MVFVCRRETLCHITNNLTAAVKETHAAEVIDLDNCSIHTSSKMLLKLSRIASQGLVPAGLQSCYDFLLVDPENILIKDEGIG
jgi:hypothetical protein